jgi:outer membrane receptor for ferrienterochelin and colicin
MRYIIFSIIYFVSITVYTQNITVSGYVTDENGEMLTGSTIYHPKSERGTQANTYGFYSLTMVKETATLVYSFVGYETRKIELNLLKDTTINIKLSQITLQTVEIRENRRPIEQHISTITLPIEQIKKIPTIGGESDIIKAFGLTPGVSNGTEGSAGLYVRGGTPDQNLILLDEAVVYNPNHLFGFISVFNPDAVKNVDLFKGGFPARYGGRLSSVLDVTMRDGNFKKNKTDVGIGILASRITLERPLIENRLSMIVSARSSYLGLLLTPLWFNYKFSNKDASYINYFMYDVNCKLNYKIDGKTQVFFSVYHGRDFLNSFDRLKDFSEDKLKLHWGNTTTTLRYNKELSPKFFWKNILLYTRFNYNTNISNNLISIQKKYEINSFSGLQDFTLRSAFDYIPNSHHYVRAGIEVTYHQFTPQFNYNLSNDTSIENRSKKDEFLAFEPALYGEDEWQITDNFKAHLGVRLNRYQLSTKKYNSIEPRATLIYSIGKIVTVKAAYSRMKQNVHLLTNNGVGLQNDIWVPSTDRISPQQSEQYAFGLSKYLSKQDIEISIEAYTKNMKNLIDYKEGANIIVNLENWQNAVEQNGKGTSQGLEFFIHKKSGRFNGFISYTLAKTDRQFEKINFGQKYAFRYDSRHNFAITANYQINNKWNVSGTWVFKSGEPITLPTAIVNANPFNKTILDAPELPIYSQRNGYRLPSYHRADIGFNRVTTTKKGHTKTWNFGIYNLYNRRNILYVQIVTKRNFIGPNTFTYNQVLSPKSLFPIIPSVSYSLSFK